MGHRMMPSEFFPQATLMVWVEYGNSKVRVTYSRSRNRSSSKKLFSLYTV